MNGCTSLSWQEKSESESESEDEDDVEERDVEWRLTRLTRL